MNKKKYFTILGLFILAVVVLVIVYIIIPKEEPEPVVTYGKEYLEYSKIYNLELSEDQSYYSITKLVGKALTIEFPNTIDDIPVKKWILDNNNGISFKEVTSVTIPANMTYIGSNANSDSIGDSFISTTFSMLATFIVDENNPVYSSESGILYNKDQTILLRCPNQYSTSDYNNFIVKDTVQEIYNGAFYCNKTIKTLTLGKNVTSIGQDAFYNCENLTNINFNDTLTTVGDYAFYQCDLETITFPDSLEKIGVNSFCGNSRLTSVTIGSNIISIGNNAFSRHSKLLNIYTSKDNVENIKQFVNVESTTGYETYILAKED